MTRNEILRRFPNATESFIRANSTPEPVAGLPVPKPKCRLQKDALVEGGGKEKSQGSPRLRLVITTARVSPVDPDNVVAKFLIDALRYEHLIKDDTLKDIILEIRQVQVPAKENEGTLVELFPDS